MWYTIFVVRTRVRLTALPATSHPVGPTKKSRNSNLCHPSAISARNHNSFTCHTYKNKELKFFCLPYILQINRDTPERVNQVAA
jgi:hypothetical protein